ncbi:DGAT1/2-independent enzyme synthesizing storage lipids-like [Tubulanus polymorphus]|uniref:DGAT1/2-independent enzyme synthesizing storage lipids-like n=1 Tax=Tubulanus polymorphus TaxID=672921 RepID=UPI003DA54301
MLKLHLIDWAYLHWLLWLLYPVIISFLLPALLVVFLYASALFLYIYQHRHRLRDAYSRDFWDGARDTLAVLWDFQGRIWHGYEIIDAEKLPTEGPALLIYYHGVVPIDMYYLLSRIKIKINRHIRCVGDKFLFKIPGFRLLMDVVGVFPGTVPSCVEVLKEGHILSIAPGGVREALFADPTYNIIWGKRVGFAKVALQAQVPIIPVFTQNCREALCTLEIGRKYLRQLYEKTRLPLVPIYGYFPVKLRTFIGDPIPYEEFKDMTPEDLSAKVQTAILDLINKHQRVPGSITRALWERICPSPIITET